MAETGVRPRGRNGSGGERAGSGYHLDVSSVRDQWHSVGAERGVVPSGGIPEPRHHPWQVAVQRRGPEGSRQHVHLRCKGRGTQFMPDPASELQQI